MSNPQVQHCSANRLICIASSYLSRCWAHQALPLLVGLSILTGCVSSPIIAQPGDERGRIASHIQFLSQPGLGGRKPGTAGSRAARRYIEDRFRQCGLVPWGKAKSYEWSFGRGKNVVAFLPGSDPSRGDEIVLVSAHYDHLGKNSKGRICPGAADNASGVGALLEVARQIALSPTRPKRSILFVSFDCEEMMLFGSFAFTCQKEVQDAKIVAVINVDMLGRDLLDVVRHTVFVAGSERYPSIRAQISEAGVQTGIRVLALGTDLVGPRGDHVAFESRGVPCLFFSCGTFHDYHEPEDTADKLNYDDIARSSTVIRNTVLELANCSTVETAAPPEDAFASELRTVYMVMSEVNENRAQAGIKPEDADAFAALAREAQELSASKRYDRRSRQKLILNAGGILAPYFMPTDMVEKNQTPEQRQESKWLLLYLQEFYLEYGPQIMEGYRGLVEQLLKYRPGLIRGMPRFQYELYDVPDDQICVRPREPNKLVLNALANGLTFSAQVKSSKWFLPAFTGYLGSSLDPLDCEGTRQQISDFCLLRLRDAKAHPKRFAAIKKVYDAVTQTGLSSGYKDLLAARLERGEFRDETAWIASCIVSGSDSLALEALDAVKGNRDGRVIEAVCQVMADTHIRADVRAVAIQLASELKSARALSVLCDVIHDKTPAYRPDFMAMTREDYPFSDRVVVKEALLIFQKEIKRAPSKTLGELAHAELKKLAKRDLGNNSARWHDWIQSHSVGSAPVNRVTAP